jgi:hypothetical protein
MFTEYAMDEGMPHLARAGDATEYLYFWRHYYEGGDDIAMFWREVSGVCRRYCEATGGASWWGGEVPITNPPKVVYDDVVGSNFFNDLMRFAVDHGIFEALTQDNPITTAHNIGTYAAKSSDGRTNTFKVPGGLMRDERHNRIREIFLGKDGLLPFYEERQQLRDEIAEREMAEEEGASDGN